jgi:hypothetical protein
VGAAAARDRFRQLMRESATLQDNSDDENSTRHGGQARRGSNAFSA